MDSSEFSDPQSIEKARRLRQDATKAERLLWSRLKGRRLGYSFRRQHPWGDYILDFYCFQAKLVIELDGLSHDNRQTLDQMRDAALESEGLMVLRYPNLEALYQLDDVVAQIEFWCDTRAGKI